MGWFNYERDGGYGTHQERKENDKHTRKTREKRAIKQELDSEKEEE